MYQSKGFVCLAKRLSTFVLFGPSIEHDLTEQDYCTNGMKPFENLADCAKARRRLSQLAKDGKPVFQGVIIKCISLSIAENETDLETLKYSRQFVLIGLSSRTIPEGLKNSRILGRYIKGCVREIDVASDFLANGFKCFKGLKEVKECWCEYTRQAQSPAAIAQLTLQHVNITR